MEDLKEAIKSEKTEDIKTKTQQLMTSSMKLGEAIYKAQQEKPEENKAQQNTQGPKKPLGQKPFPIKKPQQPQVKPQPKKEAPKQ